MCLITKYDSWFGYDTVLKMLDAGILPAVIYVSHTSVLDRYRMFKRLATKIGFFDAFRYNLKFFSKILIRRITFGIKNPLPDFNSFHTHVVHCNNVNSLEIANDISHKGIFKIILAQSGIIRSNILSIPGAWIVNAHPGKLPYYRGVDVVKWALYEFNNIYVTLHIVRMGVDTGEILKEILVPIYQDDDIDTLEVRSLNISKLLLVEAALHGPKHFANAISHNFTLYPQRYLMKFSVKKNLYKNWKSIKEVLCNE